MILNIDWKSFFIGEENWEFLFEIALRTFIMYFIILIGLRLLGKRGVRQLSVFELVVIISLGSAAGDPMFYKEIGLLIPVIIFFIIVGAYRLTTYLTAKSEKLDDLIEGKCVYLIKQSKFNIEEFKKEVLAQDEFFAELRQQSISHLGQVENVILETSGTLSVYFYPDEKVQFGLPILPELFAKKTKILNTNMHYACSFCGNVDQVTTRTEHICPNCNHNEWVIAINNCRIK
ncbi:MULTISPECIES: DUF421 domain-containing protein [Pedobacter]|uniref:DUF421 domain-containing protein n=1 Tax=Pedobacter TaxID=84567 RepID=UPI00121B70B6|nr:MULTISPECIES: YetF domain-containing protein [Pedobacter]RZL38057.1 MAG: DUF421 domain-containing protein [Pedobacter sp.]